MPTPDLPVELWLKILTYLPQSALRKVMGVNRTLFELALNDIYEEVRFISNDKDTLKTFKQLRNKSISRRVRHLFIRPAFLPGIDEVPSSLQPNLKHKLASRMTYFKNVSKNPLSLTTINGSPEELSDPTYEILTVAKHAVKSCPNLRSLTITVHDHLATPLFLTFLDSLWKSDSIGPNLRKIAIDCTVANIPLFVKPLVKAAGVLTNFEEFELNLSTSRFSSGSEQWLAASSALVSLFTAFKGTFTILSFSLIVPADLSTMFDKLPRLPKLLSLEILAVLNSETFPQPEPLTQFISQHSPTLQSLTIKPHARNVAFYHSDDSYTTWLEAPGIVDGFVDKKKFYSFSQLEMPQLRTLEVGLRVFSRYRMNPNSSLPCLGRVAPGLSKFVMTDTQITAQQLKDTLRSLTPASLDLANKKPVLEELTFSTNQLSPFMFDLLAESLPRLKRLTIEYEDLSANTTDVEPGYDRDFATIASRFKDAMHARRYTRWGLTYLRLVRPSSCGFGHPCISDMKTVAQGLSEDLVLDVEAAEECQCTTYTGPGKLPPTLVRRNPPKWL